MSLAAITLLCFPLAQIFLFGTTDYQRRADAAVVFGARVYSDGRPSTALADRVRTACDLYHRGLVSILIFSGGPGDGSVHETDAMRTMALKLGVPGNSILVDRDGLNTYAAVCNTKPIFERRGFHRVLAVSHFYHLARIKLTYQRGGCSVLTVPAKQNYILTKMPLLIAREVAALWRYYLLA